METLTAKEREEAAEAFKKLARAGAAENPTEVLKVLQGYFGVRPNAQGVVRSYHMALVAPEIVADWTKRAYKLDLDADAGDMVALVPEPDEEPAPGERPAFQAMVACLNDQKASAEAIVANEFMAGKIGALTMMNQWLVFLATDALLAAREEGVEL